MPTTVGILGAGQLGAYLCRAAANLGVKSVVLASRTDEMAAGHADEVIIGALGDLACIDQVLEKADVVTFEREDVPADALAHLAREAEKRGVRIAPGVPILQLLQNKADQKRWLVDHEIPTAPFVRYDDGISDPSQLVFGPKCVIKHQRGGYDGLGVAVVDNGDIPSAFAAHPCILEEWVAHELEIAVLVARSDSGDVRSYPVFAADFDGRGNVLRQVVCPADIAEGVADTARDLAARVVSGLSGVGVFAVEMFVNGQDVVVNEISPRVHNVGHLTMEASATSQFEQHVRAVCGMPLGAPELVRPAAMNNLLYEPDLDAACRQKMDLDQSDQGVYVHWYGKSEPRPLRKMGHLTVVADSTESAAVRADSSVQQLRAS